MLKMRCPVCDVECDQYGTFKTIGECPKCKGLFTLSDGGQPQLYKFGVGINDKKNINTST
jgi:Zn-finger nucleic acid-binding protein